jgi:hypothetical protein
MVPDVQPGKHNQLKGRRILLLMERPFTLHQSKTLYHINAYRLLSFGKKTLLLHLQST